MHLHSSACATPAQLHQHCTFPASCSRWPQDFYNLVDVYLDAVLHPNCIKDPQIFAQEGWHYELDDPKVSDLRIP